MKLTFGNTLPAGVSAGNTDEAVVTITDDDVPSVAVSFEQGSYNVDEGDTVDVTVTLSEDPERTVTVPLTKTDQDGASSADYSGVPASVEFARWRHGGGHQLHRLLGQRQRRRGEREAGLREHPARRGESRDHREASVVTITDDDVPSVEVSFEQAYTVAEGSLVTVKVMSAERRLSEDPESHRHRPTDQD